jgi:6-pyruvoyltetrahydropterin/6-carboxytetrahydropterin synthase
MKPVYTIRVVAEFSAAHVLHGYPGACERVHGHNWKVEVEAVCHELDDIGMGVDFRVLAAATKAITDELDHRMLNEHPAFAEKNPTAEHVAAYMWTRLGRDLAAQGLAARVRLQAVTVRENERSSVTYSEA